MNRELFALNLAATTVSFFQDVRVVKAAKKDKDAAKAKGIAETAPEFPQDKQLPLVRPDFSSKANAVAFIGGFFDAAEQTKSGSADELLARVFRSRLADATIEAIGEDGASFDEAKFIKFLTSEVSGTKTLSQLKSEHAGLATELITLGEFYRANEADPAAIVAAGYSDTAALLLVINNKSKQWKDTGAIIAAREADAAKRKEKADAKKKAEAGSSNA